MQVQRFRNESVRAVLADVRAALGPDALVLSTNSVRARGWRRLIGHREVEIAAALPAIPMSESRPELPNERPSETAGSELVARLVAAGVERGLAVDVVAALPVKRRRQPSRQLLLDRLAQQLSALTDPDEAPADIEVFVGPPGVGKTTTVAKLASRTRALAGQAPTLVGADAYRVGAVEQLRIYAEILGATFLVARTPSDLERIASGASAPMLVDTAGRSPNDDSIRDLFDLLGGRPGVRTHLVMAAATSTRDAERVLASYAAARPSRVVLTKIDESETPGPLVSVLRGAGLKVSWLGCGQRVPEDLRRADGRLLAAIATGEPGVVMQSTERGAAWRAACV